MNLLILSSSIKHESIEQLSMLGYEVLTLPEHHALPKAIASHPDSLIFRGEDRIIVDEEYFIQNGELFSDLKKRIPSLKIELSTDKLGDKYPYDTRLNAITLGQRIFCHRKSISNTIIRYAEEKSLDIIDTKQGYPACSTLKISENAVITSDRGLSAVYKEHGISVYEIERGEILLPPYEYGFIGGASAVLGRSICFFGDVTRHPSYKIIEKALSEHSLTAFYVGDYPLRDLGGGILL